MRYLAIFLLCSLMLCGCTEFQQSLDQAVSVANSEVSQNQFEIVQRINLDIVCVAQSDEFMYFLEPVTNVMYLWRKSGYSGGLTVMLDIDGQPLTYDRFISLYE